MSGWDHAICGRCWEEDNPGRIPFVISQAPEEKCCFCGQPTTAGIYVRRHPESGKHCNFGEAHE